jgi:hypothetical protein
MGTFWQQHEARMARRQMQVGAETVSVPTQPTVPLVGNSSTGLLTAFTAALVAGMAYVVGYRLGGSDQHAQDIAARKAPLMTDNLSPPMIIVRYKNQGV